MLAVIFAVSRSASICRLAGPKGAVQVVMSHSAVSSEIDGDRGIGKGPLRRLRPAVGDEALMSELRRDDREDPHVVRIAHVLSVRPPALCQQARHERLVKYPGPSDRWLRRDVVEPGGTVRREE